jgi:hypothetical protein
LAPGRQSFHQSRFTTRSARPFSPSERQSQGVTKKSHQRSAGGKGLSHGVEKSLIEHGPFIEGLQSQEVGSLQILDMRGISGKTRGRPLEAAPLQIETFPKLLVVTYQLPPARLLDNGEANPSDSLSVRPPHARGQEVVFQKPGPAIVVCQFLQKLEERRLEPLELD